MVQRRKVTLSDRCSLLEILNLKSIGVLSCEKVCVKKLFILYLMILMCVSKSIIQYFIRYFVIFRKIFAESVQRSTRGSYSSVFDLVCVVSTTGWILILLSLIAVIGIVPLNFKLIIKTATIWQYCNKCGI